MLQSSVAVKGWRRSDEKAVSSYGVSIGRLNTQPLFIDSKKPSQKHAALLDLVFNPQADSEEKSLIAEIDKIDRQEFSELIEDEKYTRKVIYVKKPSAKYPEGKAVGFEFYFVTALFTLHGNAVIERVFKKVRKGELGNCENFRLQACIRDNPYVTQTRVAEFQEKLKKVSYWPEDFQYQPDDFYYPSEDERAALLQTCKMKSTVEPSADTTVPTYGS